MQGTLRLSGPRTRSDYAHPVVTNDSRELWHRKIEALNRQIEELVETRDKLYRLLADNTVREIHDGDYEVVEEAIEALPFKPRPRDFT